MPEDGVPLLTQFLRTHRHAHLDVGHIPFCPGPTVHPYPAVLQPLGTGFLLLVDGGEYGISTLTMRAMRVSEIGCHIDLMRLYLLQQLHDRLHIALRHGQLLNLAALVERQVEEVDMILGDMVIATGITGLATTDQTLHGEDGLIVPIPLFLLLQVTHDFTIANLDDLVGAVGKEFVEAVDEVHIEPHLFICHSDIARCLVGHMHVVLLLHQPSDGASHRDDIVVGVGGEDDDPLGVGLGPLRAGGVVYVRLAARPSGDGVLQFVEHFDVHQSGLSVELLDEVAQAVVHIVLGGEFQ